MTTTVPGCVKSDQFRLPTRHSDGTSWETGGLEMPPLVMNCTVEAGATAIVLIPGDEGATDPDADQRSIGKETSLERYQCHLGNLPSYVCQALAFEA